MKYLILLALILAITTASAKQKYYKWTDADGNVHYSETKPENKATQEVSVNTSQPKITPKANETEVEKDPIDTEGKTEEQIKAERINAESQAQIQKLQNEANCKIAKKNLETFMSTIRVSRKDPETGEVIRLDDNQRATMLATAKKTVKEYCK
jgi:hypothetical protein